MNQVLVAQNDPLTLEELSTEFVTTRTLGLRVDALKSEKYLISLLSNLPEQCLMTFVNPSSLAAQRKNASLQAMLKEFDVVAPDGVGMCLAIRLLHGRRALRMSFDNSSLAPAVFKMAAAQQRTVALIGARPGVANKARIELEKTFPELNIVGTISGYVDTNLAIEQLMELSPDIIICGMGVGLQERLLLSLRDLGWNGWGFTCGGFLDQLAQGYRYYPSWIDSMNLRWLYRLYREPRRLWYRYAVEYPYFGARLLKEVCDRALARAAFARRYAQAEDDVQFHKLCQRARYLVS
jgi:N-acetylglucosaminyldiphosphoundecaprenol N-acetyl-beta-D-mannosaminyltransferase